MTLADNISPAGLALGVERIEGQIQSFIRGLPSVDGATLARHNRKNRFPDQRAPVIARATPDRDR